MGIDKIAGKDLNRFSVYNFFKYLITKGVCEIILLLCLITTISYNWTTENYKTIIRSDGHGYYLYLPAIFIYGDLQYDFIPSLDKRYGQNLGGVLNRIDGKKVDKYFSGIALLWSPFFLTAHLLSRLLGYEIDGYSFLYQIAISLAAVFYLWIGSRYLKKLLLKYQQSDGLASFCTFITVFGTNLYFYTFFDGFMSHVYSFSIICIYCYYVYEIFHSNNSENKIQLSFFLLALITLIRPTNVLIILFSLCFAENHRNIIAVYKKNIRKIIIGIIIFIVVISLQFVLWYLQTGHFILWSYKGESFDFTNPQIFKVLLSYRKGLFIYTPLLLLALLGTIVIYRKNKFHFYSLSIFLVLITYVISSWWCWWYGSGLGARSFIDFYVIAGLLLIFSYRLFSNKRFLKLLFFILTLSTVAYSQIQTYQYTQGILLWDVMTKEKYWEIFLQTSKNNNKVENIKEINLKAFNGKYTATDIAFTKKLSADRDKASSWEKFELYKLEHGKYALKANNGMFVCADMDSSAQLIANRSRIGLWEIFYIEEKPNGKIAIRAHNGKYVSVHNNMQLIADQVTVKERELFKLISLYDKK